MRFGKSILYLLTALFLAVILYCGFQEQAEFSLSAVITSDGKTEQVDIWHDIYNPEECYLFLPGYADLSQTQIRTNSENPVYLDCEPLTDGMTCENLQLNRKYDLTYTAGGETRQIGLTLVQSGNVASMYIDLASGSMDYVHEKVDNKESGKIRVYREDGSLNYSGDLESMEGRGNSTWNLPKKPYNLTLSAEADLLEMGAAQRWILLANGNDASNLKNKLVFDFADAAGLAYSPDSEWVDLYLNGEYAGLYQLCERNEVHAQRVNISKENSFLVCKDGSWRFEEKGQPYISLESNAALRILYSDFDTDTLTSMWQSAENAILAEDGIDPKTGKHWTELIDLDSWARKYLIEEVFANSDGVTYSQFFYCDGGGKICAGPVWDYDLAMGSAVSWEADAFYANLSDLYGSPWYAALYEKEAFLERVTELYRNIFRPLMQQMQENGIDGYISRIEKAAAMNQIRWKDTLHSAVYNAVSNAEVIRSGMAERIEFLDSVWLEKEEYCIIKVYQSEYTYISYAVKPGETLPELPKFADTETTVYLGWYRSDTDEPFDVTQPIYEDAVIFQKKEARTPENSEYAGEEVSVLRYAPIAIFAAMAVIVCAADGILRKRDERKSNDRSKSHKISS